MGDLSDLRKTIALYCRDLIDEVSDIPEFEDMTAALDKIVLEVMESSQREDLMAVMRDHLDKFARLVMKYYTGNPQSRYLDRLYGRIESIKEMCENLI